MYTSKGISTYSLRKILLKTFTAILIANVQPQQLFAQLADDFNDGEFSSNPAWQGTNEKFSVALGELKLAAPAATDNAYLSTSSQAINNATWEFTVRLDFNPSSTNFSRVYLVSTSADLSGATDGYFVLIGGTSDEVSLYRQDGVSRTRIIDGMDGRLNFSTVSVRVRVTRDDDGSWTLFSDVGNTGAFAEEGAVNDLTHVMSEYFGVYCEYTSTRSDKFFFDDVNVVGDAFVDNVAPIISDVIVLSSDQLEVAFSETLDSASAVALENYHIAERGHPNSVLLSETKDRVVLSFPFSFANGVESTLIARQVKDIYGNKMDSVGHLFLFFQPSPVLPRDIIVTEFFADFSPVIGLPEAEFVEIYNQSVNPVQLESWRITDGSSVGYFPGKIILPGDYVIVTSSAAAGSFSTFGSVIGLANFPTLNNSGDFIILKDESGVLVDSINYSSSWYGDPDKAQGGWTLERINLKDECKGMENWTASLATQGGTPGIQNSVNSNELDTDPPFILSASQISSNEVSVQFNEKLEETLPESSQITLAPALTIDSIFFSNNFNDIVLRTQEEIRYGKSHHISFEGIGDCPGNETDGPIFGWLYFDQTPALITWIEVLSDTTVVVHFSEAVEGSYTTAILINDQPTSNINFSDSSITVTSSGAFHNGHPQTLKIDGVDDINGNTHASDTMFLFFERMPVAAKDIIITEIFADPSPIVSLPEFEFVEIFNRSSNPISLDGWTFTDLSSFTTLPEQILLPGEYAIICSKTSANLFNGQGRVIAVSNFPTLNNSGETILIKDNGGNTIDSIAYSSLWYRDVDKKEGGWTLELIDPNDFCSDSANWAASIDSIGGTPGHINSVYAVNHDIYGPEILRLEADSAQLTVTFSEKLNGVLPPLHDIFITPSLQIDSVYYADNLRQINITLAQMPEIGRAYKVSLFHLADCPGNVADSLHGYLNYDTIPPLLKAIEIKSERSVRLIFSERIDQNRIKNQSHFLLADSIAATFVITGDSSVLIAFETPFSNGFHHALTAAHIVDINGNETTIDTTFLYFVPKPIAPRDVIITEIFADPSPSVGLPASEFVELLNRSQNPVDLFEFQLTDKVSTAKLPSQILMPNEYVIVCSKESETNFSSYARVVGAINFPTLGNNRDTLLLRASGVALDSVIYSLSSYHDVEKQSGGWSLERIDINNFCETDQNWIASVSTTGGTPGYKNSVDSVIIDLQGPRTQSANAKLPDVIEITFDEPIVALPGLASVDIQPELEIDSIFFFGSRAKINLRLKQKSTEGKSYAIRITNVHDCEGNYTREDDGLVYLNYDTIPPSVLSAVATSDSTLSVIFSPYTDAASARHLDNYNIVNTQARPASISFANDTAILKFETRFTNGVSFQLSIHGVADINGNVAHHVLPFRHFVSTPVAYHDVIINEFLPDPLPVAGLPEYEFIELHNKSFNAVDLNNWTIGDKSASGKLTSFILLPGEFLVLCPSQAVAHFPDDINVVGVAGFPSLNNSIDTLLLKDGNGRLIDSVGYSNHSYADEDKQTGGWSLERINPHDVCKEEENWGESIDDTGGTPGRINSIFNEAPDMEGPRLLSVEVKDSLRVLLSFNEKLETNSSVSIGFTPALQLNSYELNADTISVNLNQSIEPGRTYAVNVSNVFDCPGNEIEPMASSGYINYDTIPPELVTVVATSLHKIHLTFNERIDTVIGLSPSNYAIEERMAKQVKRLDEFAVEVEFDDPFANGTITELHISAARDINNNERSFTVDFTCFQSASISYKDVVITEIMPDPSPVVGLPEVEYIELFNRSANPVQLQNWAITDGSSNANLPPHILLPGHYVFLCNLSDKDMYQHYDNVLGVSKFPSLNNDNETLQVINANGTLVDAVDYADDWYGHDDYRDGGYSLEIIDPDNICAGSKNWTASEDDKGGTPGRQNSVDAEMLDAHGPEVVDAFAIDSLHIKILFNEKLSGAVPPTTSFQISPLVEVVSVNFLDETLSTLLVDLSEPFAAGTLYTLTVNDIYDCTGNIISPESNSVSFALPQTATPNSVVINEILFNPRSGGADFVELYNLSEGYINLKNWTFANVTDTAFTNHKIISTEDIVIGPGAFIVFSPDVENISNEYPLGERSVFVQTSLPNLNDDGDHVALLDINDNVIDQLAYTDDMHSVFLRETEGVSLERIYVDEPSTEENWRSASAGSGFATPGKINSNAVPRFDHGDHNVIVTPRVFQPDASDQNFAEIRYKFEHGGQIANVRIHDSQGRLVKTIAENEMLAAEGFVRWNGDEDNGSKARIGYYMVWFEVFDADGNVNTFKERVAIAGQF